MDVRGLGEISFKFSVEYCESTFSDKIPVSYMTVHGRFNPSTSEGPSHEIQDLNAEV